MKHSQIEKIALGGGCHWCTEAVFQSLKGVERVGQGYVSSTGEQASFSEAIIVYFNPEEIPLRVLIEIHMHTHKSTSDHSMRDKYRSAVYTFSEAQKEETKTIIKSLQTGFEKPLITKVYPFAKFRTSRKSLHNYYYTDPSKPFCETFINPKLKLLLDRFQGFVKLEKIGFIS